MTVMGALRLEVLGGVVNVQLAARLTKRGASALRRTNSSTWVFVVVVDGAAATEPKRAAARAVRAKKGTAIIVFE